MNKILLSVLALGLSANTFAQTTDTVELGAGYANTAWYSLQNDEQVNVTKSDWDIAFQTTGFGSSIRINPANSINLYMASNDTSDWANLSINNLSNWTQLYNSDTSWVHGAFSSTQTGGLDLGWGAYNMITHHVTGNKLFVIQLSNGEYQKVWIKSLASNVYTFRHANMDNTMDMTHTLSKTAYAGKNFAYYSLQNHQAIDKEPMSADWDLMFGQYKAPEFGWYLVSGVLSNLGTRVAQADPVDQGTYVDHASETFNTAINVIGFDWKKYGGGWTLSDTTVFFVETRVGDVWKLYFTGFSGSSAGRFIFSKENLSATGIIEKNQTIINAYPNPTTDRLNLTYRIGDNGTAQLIDLQGKVVSSIPLSVGFTTTTMDVSNLNAGVYVLRVTDGQISSTQRIIVQ